MKELYIAPKAKLIGFVASEKIAADLSFKNFFGDITLTNGSDVKSTDIKIPLV